MPLALRGVLARGRRSNSVCPLRTAKDHAGRMGYRPPWTAMPYRPGGGQRRRPFLPGEMALGTLPAGFVPMMRIGRREPKGGGPGF